MAGAGLERKRARQEPVNLLCERVPCLNPWEDLMSLKEQLFGFWSQVKDQVVKAWDWATKKVQGAESMCSNLVSTEPGFEISKRVISSMPQAAITVIAIQIAMFG